MKYKYQGNERLETDYQHYVKIHWNDGTVTRARARKGDKFALRYGILIATLKKFAPNINIDAVEATLADTGCESPQVKAYLFMSIVHATAGKRCVDDIAHQDFYGDSTQDIKQDLGKFLKGLELMNKMLLLDFLVKYGRK